MSLFLADTVAARRQLFLLLDDNYFSPSTTTTLGLLGRREAPAAGRRAKPARTALFFIPGERGFVAVGKWETCFWFSTFPSAFVAGAVEMWESRPLLARFPRGCGKRGKAASAFPRFPWTRHFHSLPRPLSRRLPSVWRFALAAPQQCHSGGPHLPRPFGVAHRLRRCVQSRKAHALL